MMQSWLRKITGVVLVYALSLSGLAYAQEMKPSADVEALRSQLAAQQEQIEKLRQTLEAQSKLLESLAGKASSFPTLGAVATTTPVLPASPVTPSAAKTAVPAQGAPASGNPCEGAYDVGAPYVRLGSTCIIPVGFMDATGFWRDKNAGSSLGSNFGSVPYNNVAAGRLSEFRFTPQNSRVGFRVDGQWKDVRFIGYNEFDFLGTNGATNITVTNGAFVPRLRLFWVDVRKGQWEFLGGQSWSMLTPNRKGISALPGDLFYSQVIDVNYMAGLTWTRQPGMRVLWHPSETFTMGLSFENPDQYIGGSAGGSSITLPAALSTLGTSLQLDNATNIGTANPAMATPSVHPDIIAKIAWDPSSRFHGEIAGIARTFKIFNPNTGAALGAQQKFSATGGGLQFGLNGEIFKNFRLMTTNYWSDGGGRYLFGQAPDVVVRSNGSLGLVHALGTVDGFEYTFKNWLFYAYYGGIYVGRQALLDANGTTRIGYGYTGSPASQNRNIQEATFGLNQTIWRSPKYGAINLMWQYEYLLRHPWYVAPGTPKGTHDNTVYANLRYTLPGSAPAIK